MNRLLRGVSAIAALILLFAFCLQAVSCSAKSEKGVDVSENASAYFTEALSALTETDYNSSVRSFAVYVHEKTGEVRSSYLQTFERTMRHGENGGQKVVSRYAVSPKDPDRPEESELCDFFTCYIREGVCYYIYDGSKSKKSYSGDYLSHVGLPSLGGARAESVSGLLKKDDLTVEFTFGNTEKSQELFIATMQLALFKTELSMGFSPMTLLAHLDPETHRMKSYTITFSGISPADSANKLFYTYTEEFFDYGAADPIDFSAAENFG